MPIDVIIHYLVNQEMFKMSDKVLLNEIEGKLNDINRKIKSECMSCEERIFCFGCKYYFIKNSVDEIIKRCF